MEDLCSIRALELIDGDPRPTFIVQLETVVRDQAATLHPIYCNEAMSLFPGLLSLACGHQQSTESLNSARWVLDPDSSEAAFLFYRPYWTSYTIRDR